MEEIQCDHKHAAAPGLVECGILTKSYGKRVVVTERECGLCATNEHAHLRQISIDYDRRMLNGKK